MSAVERDERDAAIDLLQDIADLLKKHPHIPVPRLLAEFWADQPGTDAAGVIAEVSALPGPWETEQRQFRGLDYLIFSSGGHSSGRRVRILAPAAEVAGEGPQRVVTDWKVRPEIAALLEQSGERS
jgi:hypothetical protein